MYNYSACKGETQALSGEPSDSDGCRRSLTVGRMLGGVRKQILKSLLESAGVGQEYLG